MLKRRTDDKLKTAGRPRCQPTPHRRWSAGAARRPGSRRPDRGPCRRRLRVRGRKSGRRPAKRRMLRRIFSQPSAAAESRAGATPLKQYWVSVSVARNGRPGVHILAAAMSCGVWVGAGTLAATSATKSSTASHHVVGGGSNQVMSAGGIAERAVRMPMPLDLPVPYRPDALATTLVAFRPDALGQSDARAEVLALRRLAIAGAEHALEPAHTLHELACGGRKSHTSVTSVLWRRIRAVRPRIHRAPRPRSHATWERVA